MPTWHIMPRKDSRMTGRERSFTQSTTEEALSAGSSSIGVESRNKLARTPIIIYTGKSTLQPRPKVGIEAIAPHMAIYGAMNEAMALTNCPKVSVEARLPPRITDDTRGLRDVCISALPIPSKENDTSIRGKFSPNKGRRRDTTVTMRESNTVFLRPILFINIPVGTEKIRNQKNTRDGSTLATESLSCKSSFT